HAGAAGAAARTDAGIRNGRRNPLLRCRSRRMIRTALTLARKNLAVFPCAARGKTPATSHGCNDATTDPEIIWQWWRENSQYNVGIATGRVSGIFVVDVDDDD